MARSRSGRRPDYTWQGNPAMGLSTASGASGLAIIATLGVSGTLVRLRGAVLASIDAPSDGDKIVVGVGIMVVTEEQLAIGVTAIPSPTEDLDADWVWYGLIPLQA